MMDVRRERVRRYRAHRGAKHSNRKDSKRERDFLRSIRTRGSEPREKERTRRLPAQVKVRHHDFGEVVEFLVGRDLDQDVDEALLLGAL